MDYNSNLSTKNVTHFTPEFENLKGIVENGFNPNEIKELAIYERPTQGQRTLSDFFTALFGKCEETEHIDTTYPIPMVCFCDIPLKLAKTHRKKYGHYGILLTKEWAIRNKISPIIYIPENSALHDIFNALAAIIDKINDESCPEAHQMAEEINKLREYIKAYMQDAEKYKYYDEREWRYIPLYFNPEEMNTYLTFEKKDFVGAIVRTKGEKEKLLKILREKFGKIKSSTIKVYKEDNCLKTIMKKNT